LPAAARTRSARAARDGGVVAEGAGAGERQPDLGGAGGGHVVEVVEDLEVVGHETLRAHEHAVGSAGAGQVGEDLADVGAAPRLWRAAG
jgi:hypothetical protein